MRLTTGSCRTSNANDCELGRAAIEETSTGGCHIGHEVAARSEFSPGMNAGATAVQ